MLISSMKMMVDFKINWMKFLEIKICFDDDLEIPVQFPMIVSMNGDDNH